MSEFNTAAPLAIYNEHRAKLAELKEYNASLHFDYASPEGNKAARSHIYKLRQSKTAVDEARANAKKDALEFGRKVDAEAKEIIGEIETMIDFHKKPLEEIEALEEKRVADIKARIESFKINEAGVFTMTATAIKDKLNAISAIVVDESYGEFQKEAATVRANTISFLQQCFELTDRRETEQHELKRLQAEKQSREAVEKEEAIRKEAAAKAIKEAEERAEKERQAAAKRESELREQAERAERAAAQAAENERRRIAEEQRKKDEAEAARAADESNKLTKHGDIHGALMRLSLDDDDATAILIAIIDGDIPHLKIVY